MKSILNNNRSNTSQPPSTNEKGGKPANIYNEREKTGRRARRQKGYKGTTFTKAQVEEKLQSGKYKHQIKNIGNPMAGSYVTSSLGN